MLSLRIIMGIGAMIGYEAGAAMTAPHPMTEPGLEWVYRITKQPKRYWQRYLRDVEFSCSSASTGLVCTNCRCIAREHAEGRDDDSNGHSGPG
jgi:hypothetical protein